MLGGFWCYAASARGEAWWALLRASRSGATNLFRAVLADGSRAEGMVFPGALIRDDDPPPRANIELVRELR